MEDLGNKSDKVLCHNPMHKVHVLVHGGRALSESIIVIKYLDKGRTRTRWCARSMRT